MANLLQLLKQNDNKSKLIGKTREKQSNRTLEGKTQPFRSLDNSIDRMIRGSEITQKYRLALQHGFPRETSNSPYTQAKHCNGGN